MIPDRPTPSEIIVRVIPGASKNEVVGEVEGIWKVRLTTPPIEGRANRALVEFLADLLMLSRRQVILRKGETSRLKTLAVYGLDTTEIAQRLRGNK